MLPFPQWCKSCKSLMILCSEFIQVIWVRSIRLACWICKAGRAVPFFWVFRKGWGKKPEISQENGSFIIVNVSIELNVRSIKTKNCDWERADDESFMRGGWIKIFHEGSRGVRDLVSSISSRSRSCACDWYQSSGVGPQEILDEEALWMSWKSFSSILG